MTRLFIVVILILSPLVLDAHPVIWKGGRALLLQSDAELSDSRFFYSLSSKFAFGARHLSLHDRRQSIGLLQANVLLKRWNQADSQGNVYAWGGAGSSVGVFGAHADWEDRRYYVAGHAEYFSLEEDDITKYRARVGIAPYIGGYEALQTWLILQFDSRVEGAESDSGLMPVIRLFKGPFLFEIGSDFDDNTFWP